MAHQDVVLRTPKEQVMKLIKKKKSVLFLCTRNAGRSQIAEALTNTYLGHQWEAYSAGTKPAERINPYTLKTLEEIGIQHEGHPKPVDEFRGEAFDLVITVCDEAEKDCPLWLGAGKQYHFRFKDPEKFKGNEGALLEKYRKLREQVRMETIPLLRKEGSKGH